LDGAKAAAFRAIESGDLVEYMIRRNIRFAAPKVKTEEIGIKKNNRKNG
jgi:hypothetical protein